MDALSSVWPPIDYGGAFFHFCFFSCQFMSGRIALESLVAHIMNADPVNSGSKFRQTNPSREGESVGDVPRPSSSYQAREYHAVRSRGAYVS